MRYFITGATGLIGSAFIRTLSESDKVIALRRSPEQASIKLTNVDCHIEFISSLQSLTEFNDIDYIVNLAGEPIADKRWTDSQKHRIQHSRWQTTTDIVSLLAKSANPPPVLISGSAIGFYGRQTSQPVTENNYTAHKEFAQALCDTWESIALSAQSDNTRVCTLRTGIVLAKNQGALGKMTLPFKIGLGGRIGSGEQGMSWIHIDDMVRAIHFLIQQKSLSGAFNLTAPNPVSNLEFVKSLGKTLNRPALLPMPAITLKLLMGESADLLLTGQYVLPERLEDAGFCFHYASLQEALQALLGNQIITA